MKKRLLYIGNQLSKHGYNKTSIETLGVFLKDEGYDVIFTSSKKNQWVRMLDMIITTFLKIRSVDYVLIDTYSTSSFWYAFFCSQIARVFNVKYIPILRGGDLPNRLKKNPKLCQMVFANAYKNVAPSGYLKQAFQEAGFTNVIYIPNSIEIEKYKFKDRIEFAPKLLWVRAFATIYNPEMAVKVLFELQRKYPNTSLTMVGPDKDGSLQTTKAFADYINCKVCFTGQLSKEDWWQLASEHDIFINTTHFDNTPISVMEAMALGLPVVSTNVGGIPYLLTDKENALLVNDNDVVAMVDSICCLIENQQKTKELTSNARNFIAQMDWNVVKEDWKQVLK
ncbi:glycosyltransferase involved in cell wall biosynthesis [Flavobacterium aquaticum]|uniref:Glycosyltransferase involved in cell wall biosynthesis n=1 Tax=Flavobacterium aquaticum TaxID=1236486 RepID=A0A327YQ20_9FLAO|nr:glycosyltransferase family 4 protein [Flavobacterium aquaticum]RAK22662.1 glycosyltransferase involved in cell wall biosynthesis [Flavobacterium aquaticum]